MLLPLSRLALWNRHGVPPALSACHLPKLIATHEPQSIVAHGPLTQRIGLNLAPVRSVRRSLDDDLFLPRTTQAGRVAISPLSDASFRIVHEPPSTRAHRWDRRPELSRVKRRRPKFGLRVEATFQSIAEAFNIKPGHLTECASSKPRVPCHAGRPAVRHAHARKHEMPRHGHFSPCEPSKASVFGAAQNQNPRRPIPLRRVRPAQ